MRVLTVVWLLLIASAIGSLSAQRRGQVEIGGFGSYTRYDSGLQLDNQFGVGGRLGFFVGDHFSLEVDGNVAQPLSKSGGGGKTTAVFGSASLVISSGSAYVLGGYSRLQMGPDLPYRSQLNALHGGLGERTPSGGASLLPRPGGRHGQRLDRALHWYGGRVVPAGRRRKEGSLGRDRATLLSGAMR